MKRSLHENVPVSRTEAHPSEPLTSNEGPVGTGDCVRLKRSPAVLRTETVKVAPETENTSVFTEYMSRPALHDCGGSMRNVPV